jgi:regulator of protease activity HflC (stomatin/prohibitin superfamily)
MARSGSGFTLESGEGNSQENKNHTNDTDQEGTIVSMPHNSSLSLTAGLKSKLKTNSRYTINSGKVTYLEPDYNSFANIKPDDHIHEAETANSFFAWAAEDKNNSLSWIRKPNANSDAELLSAVNGDTENYTKNAGRSAKVILHMIATLGTGAVRVRNILPGSIQFSNNAGTPMIHNNPGLAYLISPRHSWGKVHKSNEDIILEGNITIVRIRPGQIGFALDNGHPIILLPGRHGFNNPQLILSPENIFDLKTKNVISFGSTLSIVRVFPNEIGLAYEGNNPVILLPGIHIKNSATFQFVTRLNTQSFVKVPNDASELPNNQVLGTFYEHGNLSIARINQGQLGHAIDGRDPVMMHPGLYIKNSRAFKFLKSQNTSDDHIQNGTIHLIRVRSDKIGLAWDNNEAKILEPDFYEYNSSTFQFDKLIPANQKIIQHGTKARIRVDDGELGYAWLSGKALELKPGVHEFDDAQFIFEKHYKANEELIQFGNLTRLIVKAGQVRPVWVDGLLEIKEAGIYNFDSPKIIIGNIITLQDTVKNYSQIQVTTQDRMPMLVTSQISYRITDAKTLVTSIGVDNVDKSIETIAHSALRQQFSKATLSMISSDHHKPLKIKGEEEIKGDDLLVVYGADNKTENEGGDDFRGNLCHNVLAKLHQETSEWGIKVKDYAISDINYKDAKIEATLAQATADIRAAEVKLELQVALNATATSKAQAEAKQNKIKKTNETELSILEAKTQADNLTAKTTAEAEAEYIISTRKAAATTENLTTAADAMLAQAKAKCDADTLLAQGQIALAQASIVLLNNPGYVEIEKLKQATIIAQHLSNAKTPAMVINGNESGGASNLSSMFFGQGGQLLQYAISQTPQTLFQKPASAENSMPLITLPVSPNAEKKDENEAKQIKFHG